jgi:hypothetical protein
MNEIVALGKTDGSLRKDGFVLRPSGPIGALRLSRAQNRFIQHRWRQCLGLYSSNLGQRSRQSSGEHRKRQTAFAGNIVIGEEEAMRGKHTTRIYPRIVV